MSYYDLYGFKAKDINLVKEVIEASLNIKMNDHGHDSDYSDGYFMCEFDSGEEFVLNDNYDEGEQDYRETEYQGFPVLLYVNESTEEKVKKYESALLANEGVELLRREEL